MQTGMIRSLLAVAAVSSLACAAPVLGQETATDGTSAYVLPEIATWDMTAAHGESYRIYVSKPEGEAPENGYPVLYVLDGNAIFPSFAAARRIQNVYQNDISKMIIVGVGHPSGELYDGRRMFDFTGPIVTPPLKALYKDYRSGGRDQFLSFLLEKLRPEIDSRYRTNPYRQSLYGHSLGGLFGLYVLYTRPEAFHTIIAASPSIWWDNQAILTEERAFRQRLEKGQKPMRISRLLLLAGEEEEEGSVTLDTELLAKRMQSLTIHGVRSEHEIFDEENHISVPARSVTPAMRHALRWP